MRMNVNILKNKEMKRDERRKKKERSFCAFPFFFCVDFFGISFFKERRQTDEEHAH